jgi:hypothetical protein
VVTETFRLGTVAGVRVGANWTVLVIFLLVECVLIYSLIKAILGFVRADVGTIRVFGTPVERTRKMVAYVPQRGTVDWDFPITVEEVAMILDGALVHCVLPLFGWSLVHLGLQYNTALREQLAEHYGHAGPALVQYLVDHRQFWPQWREWYRECPSGNGVGLIESAEFLKNSPRRCEPFGGSRV